MCNCLLVQSHPCPIWPPVHPVSPIFTLLFLLQLLLVNLPCIGFLSMWQISLVVVHDTPFHVFTSCLPVPFYLYILLSFLSPYWSKYRRWFTCSQYPSSSTLGFPRAERMCGCWNCSLVIKNDQISHPRYFVVFILAPSFWKWLQDLQDMCTAQISAVQIVIHLTCAEAVARLTDSFPQWLHVNSVLHPPQFFPVLYTES